MARIVNPCAACKIQRRKCGDKCVLTPHFPPNDPQKYLVLHKFFGARSLVKILQDIPDEKRADAVTSLVYEASMRVNDPIYGCTGAICRLQKQVLHLQSQLATTQAELLNAQAYHASLLAGICNSSETLDVVQQNDPYKDEVIVLQDDEDPFGLWAPL